jgi:phosphopantetheine--protein transferase-like protein
VLLNLLGKLVMETKLLAFLERLLGGAVDRHGRFPVSSIERAQIFAWLNENGFPSDINRHTSRLLSVDDLLASGEGAVAQDEPGVGRHATPTPTPTSTPQQRIAPVASQPAAALLPLGLGVDLQSRASLPETTDLRGDPFYARNFTDRELSYSIQQSDPIETLCGLWAAKEAVTKAGAGHPAKAGQFGDIEIGRDRSGAPTFPNCLVSISHEAGLAIAVCVRYA